MQKDVTIRVSAKSFPILKFWFEKLNFSFSHVILFVSDLFTETVMKQSE